MTDVEVSDGPYLRWLQSIRERVGERLWDTFCEMPAGHVDPWLRAHGILPFKDSVEGVRLRQAKERGDTTTLVKIAKVGGSSGEQLGSPRVFKTPDFGGRRARDA